MKKSKIIESRCLTHDGSSHIWTLAKTGFEIVAAQLPPLKERGFKSEHPTHDLVASAFHQGNLVNSNPRGLQLISEQQLRRVDDEFISVKQGLISILRRPDGITQYGSKWFAFEVELSVKKACDYELIGEYYDNRGYQNVFWLVLSRPQAERIRKNLSSHFDNSNQDLHHFFLYQDFVKSGWAAQSLFVDDLQFVTLTQLLQYSDNASTAPYTPCLLDVRKYPLKSKPCRILKVADLSD